MNSKNLKNKIIDFIKYIQKKFNIPDNIMFLILYIYHHIQQLICGIIILFNSNIVIMLVNLILLLVFLFSFIYFRGCIITQAEQKLERNDIIVGDMYMDILGIGKTYYNRLLSSTLVIIGMAIIQLYKIFAL